MYWKCEQYAPESFKSEDHIDLDFTEETFKGVSGQVIHLLCNNAGAWEENVYEWTIYYIASKFRMQACIKEIINMIKK